MRVRPGDPVIQGRDVTVSISACDADCAGANPVALTILESEAPAQALCQYRREFVGDAKAVVVVMTSNGFTLADPDDRGMLDVVGFDTSVPSVIADFVRS